MITSDRKASARAPTSLLSLPNELLHIICTHVDSTKTFFTLSLVNHCLYQVTHTPQTRQSFASQWLLTNSDGSLGSPRIIEFIIRFVRLHSATPHTCIYRKRLATQRRFPYPSPRAPFLKPLDKSQWGPQTYRRSLIRDLHRWLYSATTGSTAYYVQNRWLRHLAATRPSAMPLTGPATIQTMILEVDDIVLAEVMVTQLRKMQDLWAGLPALMSSHSHAEVNGHSGEIAHVIECQWDWQTHFYFPEWKWLQMFWDCRCELEVGS